MKGTAAGFKLAAACAAAALCAGAHGAQAGPPADELLGNPHLVFAQLDAGQVAAIWQETAPFVRAKYAADGFESGLVQSRKALGTVDHRGWAAITRLTYSHDKVVPDGLYANVDYATWLADGRIVYEKVSFQLGGDGRWHFTGYEPRQSQSGAPAAAAQSKQ